MALRDNRTTFETDLLQETGVLREGSCLRFILIRSGDPEDPEWQALWEEQAEKRYLVPNTTELYQYEIVD